MSEPSIEHHPASIKNFKRSGPHFRDRITASASGPDGYWPVQSGWSEPHGREALGGRPFGDGTPPAPLSAPLPSPQSAPSAQQAVR